MKDEVVTPGTLPHDVRRKRVENSLRESTAITIFEVPRAEILREALRGNLVYFLPKDSLWVLVDNSFQSLL